jgi:hypothetical protein
MFPRLQRSWLLGAVLAALALLPARESCHAQAPGAATGEAATGTVQKPDAAARKRESASPPFPGQLTNSTAGKGADERHKRIPPILIAFVLLFLITWVRAYLERRRLRASFRQSCEFPPQ